MIILVHLRDSTRKKHLSGIGIENYDLPTHVFLTEYSIQGPAKDGQVASTLRDLAEVAKLESSHYQMPCTRVIVELLHFQLQTWATRITLKAHPDTKSKKTL